MKFSQFNVWCLSESGLILFNTLTSALALFEGKHIPKVQKALESKDVNFIPDEFLPAMREDGYIVDRIKNEDGDVDLAVKERMSRTDEYSLCILLNKRCNFGCFYCFEHLSGKSLIKEEEDALIKMFEQIAISAKKISIDWFGGEPLLSFNVIKRLNDKFIGIAQSHNVEYCHSITTNGYCLTERVIEYFLRTPPTEIAVTIDGPPETHNQSRPLRNGMPTFDVIMRNITAAVLAGLRVSVRVNATKLNLERIPELYDILEQQGLKNRVEVNIQFVVSSDEHPCEHICLSSKESSAKVMGIYKEMAKRGWIVLPPIDEMRVLGFCVNEYPNRYFIDLGGSLYRCGHMLGTNRSVGCLEKTGAFLLDQEANQQWVQKSPFDFRECRGCAFVPLCMGGCNLKRELEGCSGSSCIGWKDVADLFLEVLLLNDFELRNSLFLSF